MSQYATTSDLAIFGLPSAVLSGISAGTQNTHLQSASSELDSALRVAGFAPPLLTWDVSVTRRICDIAAYTLANVIGYSPEGGDELIVERYRSAQTWLSDVAARRLVICPASADSTADYPERCVLISSETPRGW